MHSNSRNHLFAHTRITHGYANSGRISRANRSNNRQNNFGRNVVTNQQSNLNLRHTRQPLVSLGNVGETTNLMDMITKIGDESMCVWCDEICMYNSHKTFSH